MNTRAEIAQAVDDYNAGRFGNRPHLARVPRWLFQRVAFGSVR